MTTARNAAIAAIRDARNAAELARAVLQLADAVTDEARLAERDRARLAIDGACSRLLADREYLGLNSTPAYMGIVQMKNRALAALEGA